ncbi:polysaccharide deacetylase [Rhizobium halophytocola]|uniref:Peptidoglycan/xylan/chitin deacetylase (PgdA/CDA1 family) n=1 Tax=Rhizobium halophytocola TaxID=735519 RepID=A0ABS4E643_9HYPH|nr:polysaccharide deacetylase [Rhizobium halophytocola]MBP1853386.1 peptidoglycan/xylan/chitin deacetylase (PgdA/CDA1 family) [Rhizobium halophytocola]
MRFLPALANKAAGVLATLLVPALSVATAHAGDRPKQYVVISFDGAGDNTLWVKSRELANANHANFTYFLSCTNLIPKADADLYKAPHHSAGHSNVGFAIDAEDVRLRLRQIWKAQAEGSEIASHACGHFNGKDWSKADWLTDMDSFDTFVGDAWKTAGIPNEEPEGWRDFVKTKIRGFRAPYLSSDRNLIAAEKAHGYHFDASPVADRPEWPEKDGDLYRFGLPLIKEGPRQRKIVAMDYNLFTRHSDAKETPDTDGRFEERAYQAFRQAFDQEYNGDRNVLQIGFHFVAMNGGAYWRALERLLPVCKEPDVACVTYSQAIAAMESGETPKTGL